jgi:hypothetical protein
MGARNTGLKSFLQTYFKGKKKGEHIFDKFTDSKR